MTVTEEGSRNSRILRHKRYGNSPIGTVCAMIRDSLSALSNKTYWRIMYLIVRTRQHVYNSTVLRQKWDEKVS